MMIRHLINSLPASTLPHRPVLLIHLTPPLHLLPHHHPLASHIRTPTLCRRFSAMIPSRDPRPSERAYVHQLLPVLILIPIHTDHHLLNVHRHRHLYQTPVNNEDLSLHPRLRRRRVRRLPARHALPENECLLRVPYLRRAWRAGDIVEMTMMLLKQRWPL